MKMKKKNWGACGGSPCSSVPVTATIGFFKDIKEKEGLSFTKEQWEYFKETIDWIFEVQEEG